MNYASTANIQEVMKFYNLGDKPFETDFSIVVLTFAAWFPIESAVSGFKGDQRP